MASLADATLGHRLAGPGENTGDTLAMSAASLAVDFITSVREGDWIEIAPEGLHTGSKLTLAQALPHRGDWLIVRMSVVLAVFDEYV